MFEKVKKKGAGNSTEASQTGVIRLTQHGSCRRGGSMCACVSARPCVCSHSVSPRACV